VTARAVAGPLLAVVGGGPAGMAAASAALARGVEVILVDSFARLGGQLHRQPAHDPAFTATSSAAGTRLPARFRHLATAPRLTCLAGTTVWLAERKGNGVTLWLDRADGPASIDAAGLVMATGATELVLPFPGWDLPGVTTAGAAQALWKGHGVRVGSRVVVAGSGPFLLPVAESLLHAGSTVLAVVEAASARWLARHLFGGLAHAGKAVEAAGYLRALRLAGVPIMTSSAVVRAEGGGAVEAVVINRIGADGRPQKGTGRRIAVDALCVSFGFLPRLELARQLGLAERKRGSPAMSVVACDSAMASSVPGIFVAGEATGIGGGAVAEIEGEIAGRSAASWLGRSRHSQRQDRAGRARDALLSARLDHARHLGDVLQAAFPERPGMMSIADDGTIACRCEDVTLGDIRKAVQSGATTVAAARGLTRCGMGHCQGRTCGRLLEIAVASFGDRPLSEVGDLSSRPIATPVPLALVADSAQPTEQ
jgi:NADPH-dependent 2,4-dienoyl-CoA reductase/sulfur reductase-like enzyme